MEERDGAIQVTAKAGHIFFLGFGYDDENMKVFSHFAKKGDHDKVIIGTGFGMTYAEQHAIHVKYQGLSTALITLTCLECLRNSSDFLGI
jgi:hypothetical protein